MGYENMGLDELVAESQKLGSQRDVIRTEMKKVQTFIDAKMAEKEIADKVANMSEAEKAAMKKALE